MEDYNKVVTGRARGINYWKHHIKGAQKGKFGRDHIKIDPEDQLKMLNDRDAGLSVNVIHKKYGYSYTPVYTMLKKHRPNSFKERKSRDDTRGQDAPSYIGKLEEVEIDKNSERGPERYYKTVNYTTGRFLGGFWAVSEWAIQEYDKLNLHKLIFLLHLNETALFTKYHFNDCKKVMSNYYRGGLHKLIEEGWVELTDEKFRGRANVYRTTGKCFKLSRDIHDMCCGKKLIPYFDRSGNDHKSGDEKKANVFLDLVLKLNKKTKER